jgi:4-carboxymuconolactone decarboxylase
VPRLPIANEQEVPELASVYAEIKESRGWTHVSNALSSLGHAPEGLKHLARFGAYLKFHSDLSERLRELVILCAARGSDYAWTNRSRLALRVGIAQSVIDQIGRGEIPHDIPPAEQVIVKFVAELLSPGSVSDATFDELRRHFSPRQVTDLAMSAVYYSGLGALARAFEVEIETPEQMANWNLR